LIEYTAMFHTHAAKLPRGGASRGSGDDHGLLAARKPTFPQSA